ncbi:MAG: hypothetical protein PHX10_00475 [Gallionellaceae bacterium]|nr:hypothetical protein [Gallionellaceae bacterium]
MPDKTLWKPAQGPSAGLVQQHFVAARLEQLYRRDKSLEKNLSEILSRHPLLASQKLKGDKWLQVYDKITSSLQKADLTINFEADSWFKQENKYDSYSQMYERAVGADGKVFLKDDKQNPADMRARTDDKVTFPAMAPGGSPTPQRGLMPGRQGQQPIESQMKFGDFTKKTAVQSDGTTKKGVVSNNPHFNPKTKQVFAALNYGRRPRGSCIGYGASHMVLNPKFKLNALYFGGDTFFIERHGAKAQAAYHTLGAVIACAFPDLVTDILKSCYQGATLPDTSAATLLLEGHLFAPLTFSGNLSTIYLSARPGSVVATNAKKFAAKHHAKLVFV